MMLRRPPTTTMVKMEMDWVEENSSGLMKLANTAWKLPATLQMQAEITMARSLYYLPMATAAISSSRMAEKA